VDGESQVSPFGGPLLPVGEVLAEFEVTKAWVNDVAWSPSGSSLAFAGHDSCLHVVVFTPGAEPVVSSLKCTGLPLMRLLFLSETVLVGAGHGLSPEVFAREGQGGAWECLGRLEKQGVEAGGAGKPAASGFGAARAMFASKVTKGQGAGEEAEAGWTRHASAVTYMQSRKRNGACSAAPLECPSLTSPRPSRLAANGLVVEFSTSGNDGRVATWPLADFVTNLDSRGSMQALGLA
jgi:actin related protein 2/3 complex subunit 1A/1B